MGLGAAFCAGGFERWKDWAGAGAVFVRGATLSVFEPRLPRLDPLPARASASTGAKATTTAVSTASVRPLTRGLPDVIVICTCPNVSNRTIRLMCAPGKRVPDLRLPVV